MNTLADEMSGNHDEHFAASRRHLEKEGLCISEWQKQTESGSEVLIELHCHFLLKNMQRQGKRKMGRWNVIRDSEKSTKQKEIGQDLRAGDESRLQTAGLA